MYPTLGFLSKKPELVKTKTWYWCGIDVVLGWYWYWHELTFFQKSDIDIEIVFSKWYWYWCELRLFFRGDIDIDMNRGILGWRYFKNSREDFCQSYLTLLGDLKIKICLFLTWKKGKVLKTSRGVDLWGRYNVTKCALYPYGRFSGN